MLTALLTIFGGGAGGLLRFVPEVFKFFTDKSDKDHEFRMSELQLQIDQARAGQQIDLAHVQGDIAQQAADSQALIEAVKAQASPTGVKWVDALNASVRPIITYWWMVLFTVYKIANITAVCLHWQGLDDFITRLWTIQDAGILSMLLGFWFVDRAMRHNSNK